MARRAPAPETEDGKREAAAPDAAEPPQPTPQPELHEPRLEDPGLSDLSTRDYLAIVVRGIKGALADNVTNLAAAVAYYLFLAIPSALLIAVGAFSIFAGPSAVQTIMDHLSSVMPQSAVALLGQSLTRTTQAQNGVVLLILGPQMTEWVGSAVGNTTAVTWVWWTAQWPILLVGLLTIFAIVLYLAPNVVPPRWQFVTPGAVFAVVVWLASSGAFAFYASRFASYNKTWGSLAAVIIMLTWLWLSALALLVGGEINPEAYRSRELRRAPRGRTVTSPGG